MMIKTYITNDMKEALTRAKYELGVDAMLISQREVRPGYWFNPFRKKMVEVTFALEDKPIQKPVEKPEEKPVERNSERSKQIDDADDIETKVSEEANRKAEEDPFYKSVVLKSKNGFSGTADYIIKRITV